jgi:myosin heavy subunit
MCVSLFLQVTYQTDLFLDKNIDYAVNEHQVLLNASKCSFVSSIFPPVDESTKSTKFTSIGSSFKVKKREEIYVSDTLFPSFLYDS